MALSIVPREACRALLGTPAAPYILHLLRQCVKPSAAAGMRGRPRVRLVVLSAAPVIDSLMGLILWVIAAQLLS